MSSRSGSSTYLKRGLRHVISAVLLGSLLALQGCATHQNPDPIEGYNRKIFAFNEGLDDHVLKPVARGYKSVTPDFFRTAVTNFTNNLTDIWSAINLFLQGHPGNGATQIMRVSVNSVFGFGGLIDIATPMRLERQNEDFGQTLGVWGVPSGAYIVWPVLGSSTLRDSTGLPGDLYFSASTVMPSTAAANSARVVNIVNTRARLLDATDLLQDVALDKYAFVRDAYLQRRRNLIFNGDPPEEPDDQDDYSTYDSGAAEPAAVAPSGPRQDEVVR